MSQKEMQIIGTTEVFLRDLREWKVTSLSKDPFRPFQIFKCGHCGKEMVLYYAMREVEEPKVQSAPMPLPVPEPVQEVKQKRKYTKREKKVSQSERMKEYWAKKKEQEEKPEEKHFDYARLSEQEKELLKIVGDGKEWHSDIGHCLKDNYARRWLSHNLEKLVKKGFLERISPGRYIVSKDYKKIEDKPRKKGTPEEEVILALEHGDKTPAEIADSSGLDEKEVEKILERLAGQGKVALDNEGEYDLKEDDEDE